MGHHFLDIQYYNVLYNVSKCDTVTIKDTLRVSLVTIVVILGMRQGSQKYNL